MTAPPGPTNGRTDAGLVPLADRVRYMQVFRLTIAVATLTGWLLLPGDRQLGLLPLVAFSAGYLLLSVATRRLWLLRRERALALFSATLLADGVYLAAVSYAASGFGTPVKYLVLLHLVAVTLLASFRTGVKLALWHSLLATVSYQLQNDHVLYTPTRTAGYGSGTELVLFLVILWLVTLATASFAAVNERELRRRNYDLQALARLSWLLESALQPHEVGQALVDAVGGDFDLPRLVLVAGREGRFAPLAGKGASPVPATIGPEGDRLIRQSVTERRTLRLAAPDPAGHPWLSRAMPNAQNVVCLPLFADGAAVGALVVEHGGGRGLRVERRTVQMLERFVSQASLALNNAWLLARVRALAAADGLTGVANRRTFDAAMLTEISRADRTGRPMSLLLFDVDHFKRLNDSFGHQAGDEALQRVAATLAAGARTIDLVARYGGEEFAVLLPDTDLETALLAADRLRADIQALAAGPSITASLGVATYPANASDPATLIQAADEALYAAKQTGRNRVLGSKRTAGTPAAVRFEPA